MIVRWPVVAARGLAVGGQAPGVRGESYGERVVRPTVSVGPPVGKLIPRRLCDRDGVRTDMTRLRRRDRPAGGPACTLVADDEPAVRRLVFQVSQVGASPASFAGNASRPLLRSACRRGFFFSFLF